VSGANPTVLNVAVSSLQAWISANENAHDEHIRPGRLTEELTRGSRAWQPYGYNGLLWDVTR